MNILDQPLIAAIVQGGALVILGIVVYTIVPRAIRLFGRMTSDFRRISRGFRNELSAERAAHRDETRELSQNIGGAIAGLSLKVEGLTNATNRQTLELQRQTDILERVEANLSGDLPVLDPSGDIQNRDDPTERIHRTRKGDTE